MVFSACHIWTLFTCYLHVYMSSTHYLSTCILCAHYLQWSLISSFLTDNTNVIHTSSLVLFIYSIMENMSSAPLPDDVSSAPLLDDMSSAPLLDDMSSTPLLDDMSSALQRNMSYLFEVWKASNRSTRQLFWFIWLFRWFKFTLKPPYSIAHDKLWLAIRDTSFWTFWLKFGHKGP